MVLEGMRDTPVNPIDATLADAIHGPSKVSGKYHSPITLNASTNSACVVLSRTCGYKSPTASLSPSFNTQLFLHSPVFYPFSKNAM
jgi:hypothetical protein